MKQKNLILTLFMAALLLLVGCRDEYAEGFKRDEIRIGAKLISSVQSRADIDVGIDYDTQSQLDISLVRWDADDENNSIVRKQCIDATLGNPDATDEWTRPIDFGVSQYYKDRTSEVGFVGWYPRTEWSGIDNDGMMTHDIDGKTDIMVSDFQKGNFSTGIPALNFRHALCMYKVYAYYVDDDAKKQWGNLMQVTFQNLPEQLFVKWPEDFTAGQAEFSYTPAPENEDSYTPVELFAQEQNGEGVELPVGTTNEEMTYLGTVLGGVPAIGVLGIGISTSNEQSGNSVSIARNFKPGYTYHIYLKLSIKGVINAEVSVGKWMYNQDEIIVDQDMKLLTDLSRYGTANCYVVSSANRGYCFDATVKGNGVNTLTKRNGTTIQLPDRNVNIANEIDHVKIYRTDAMVEVKENGSMSLIEVDKRPKTEMITLLSDKLSEGKVKFWVNGFDDENNYALKYKGNVKIAAYNAQGDIVWSWHIWITDKPQNQGYQNGTVAMDRNLGAVTASPTSPVDYQDAMTVWAGLFYQWGRKDAIFRRTVDEVYATEGFPISISETPVTVAYAHQHPSTYFYDPNGNNWTTDTDVNDNFWGYISDREDIVKTIYDPCPPGYRVTGNAMWESQAEDMSVEKPAINNSGYFFHIGDYTKVYYPSTACVSDGKVYQDDLVSSEGTEANNYVYQLSATPGEDGTAYHFRYEQSAYQTSGGIFEILASDASKYRTKRSAAYPVRCVFEESGPVVTDLSAVQTANSYIIRRSGYYKFKANVRGNGVTSLQVVVDKETGASKLMNFDGGLGQTISASQMGKADVLWWQGDLTTGSKYYEFVNGGNSVNSTDIDAMCPIRILDDGQIYDNEIMFYANVNEGGNVGIALYDRNGVILWTWHIWIVPEGVMGKQFGDYILMDRNLGATYAPASADEVNATNIFSTFGFYYQWGRKDPMFGPGSYSATQNRSKWFLKNNGVWTEQDSQLKSKNNVTLGESVQNPLSYLTSDSYWWQTTYAESDWINPEDKNPNPNKESKMRNLWGYTGQANETGNAFAKTMWDPCPPGYKVMNHLTFESANLCNSGGTNLQVLTGPGLSLWGILLNNGLQADDFTQKVSANNVWFPFSGNINEDGTSFGNIGDKGYVFSSTPNEGGKTARALGVEKVSQTYKAGQEGTQSHKISYPVRCVME